MIRAKAGILSVKFCLFCAQRGVENFSAIQPPAGFLYVLQNAPPYYYLKAEYMGAPTIQCPRACASRFPSEETSFHFPRHPRELRELWVVRSALEFFP